VDVRLPGMNGFELLELLAKQFSLKEILIVAISAYDEIFHVNRAYAVGAQTFLSKPVHAEDIRNMTRAFKGQWASDQQWQPRATVS